MTPRTNFKLKRYMQQSQQSPQIPQDSNLQRLEMAVNQLAVGDSGGSAGQAGDQCVRGFCSLHSSQMTQGHDRNSRTCRYLKREKHSVLLHF